MSFKTDRDLFSLIHSYLKCANTLKELQRPAACAASQNHSRESDARFKGDPTCFSLFFVVYIMLQCQMYMFNVANISNNEVNYEQKTLRLHRMQRFQRVFFYLHDDPTTFQLLQRAVSESVPEPRNMVI